MAYVITNPPPLLRELSAVGLWINVECEKCRRVRSLRPFEIARIVASRPDATLSDLRGRGKCSGEGCDGRPKRIEVSMPGPEPAPQYISWEEVKLLAAMKAERF